MGPMASCNSRVRKQVLGLGGRASLASLVYTSLFVPAIIIVQDATVNGFEPQPHAPSTAAQAAFSAKHAAQSRLPCAAPGIAGAGQARMGWMG